MTMRNNLVPPAWWNLSAFSANSQRPLRFKLFLEAPSMLQLCHSDRNRSPRIRWSAQRRDLVFSGVADPLAHVAKASSEHANDSNSSAASYKNS